MTRNEKEEVVLALKEQIEASGNFYITDTSNLTVAQINNIRRKCFDAGITMQVAKNKLIQKAMDQIEGGDFEPLHAALKGSSTLLFFRSG